MEERNTPEEKDGTEGTGRVDPAGRPEIVKKLEIIGIESGEHGGPVIYCLMYMRRGGFRRICPAGPKAGGVLSPPRLWKKKNGGDPNKEEKQMTKTLKVEGMMCVRCEARVKKTLEAIPGVENAVADHAAGTAVVTLSAPVADETLVSAVEAQGYKVSGVK